MALPVLRRRYVHADPHPPLSKQRPSWPTNASVGQDNKCACGRFWIRDDHVTYLYSVKAEGGPADDKAPVAVYPDWLHSRHCCSPKDSYSLFRRTCEISEEKDERAILDESRAVADRELEAQLLELREYLLSSGEGVAR